MQLDPAMGLRPSWHQMVWTSPDFAIAWKTSSQFFLGLGRATMEVRFHPPVAVRSMASRKALSDFCHQVVAGGLADALGVKGDGPAPGAAGP